MIPKLKIPKGYRQIRLGEKMPEGTQVLQYDTYFYPPRLIMRTINPFYIEKRMRIDFFGKNYRVIIKK